MPSQKPMNDPLHRQALQAKPQHSNGMGDCGTDDMVYDKKPHAQDGVMTPIYLGLGGNITNELGDPTSHILAVADALANHADFANVRLSSLYRSKPFGVLDQPDFVNAVLSADTRLSPLPLLDFCQSLEQMAGRVRLRHWGERSLDVDILLYGDTNIDHARLSVPHKGLFLRNFVLIPLAELAPHLVVNGVALATHPLAHDSTGLIKLDILTA